MVILRLKCKKIYKILKMELKGKWERLTFLVFKSNPFKNSLWKCEKRKKVWFVVVNLNRMSAIITQFLDQLNILKFG